MLSSWQAPFPAPLLASKGLHTVGHRAQATGPDIAADREISQQRTTRGPHRAAAPYICMYILVSSPLNVSSSSAGRDHPTDMLHRSVASHQ